VSGSAAYVCFRTEDVLLKQAGSGVLVTVTVDSRFTLKVVITRGAKEKLGIVMGIPVIGVPKAGVVHLVPRSS